MRCFTLALRPVVREVILDHLGRNNLAMSNVLLISPMDLCLVNLPPDCCTSQVWLEANAIHRKMWMAHLQKKSQQDSKCGMINSPLYVGKSFMLREFCLWVFQRGVKWVFAEEQFVSGPQEWWQLSGTRPRGFALVCLKIFTALPSEERIDGFLYRNVLTDSQFLFMLFYLFRGRFIEVLVSDITHQSRLSDVYDGHGCKVLSFPFFMYCKIPTFPSNHGTFKGQRKQEIIIVFFQIWTFFKKKLVF